jgi:hypothetical protein
MEDPLPASNVIGGGQTQRRRPWRNRSFAGTGHGSALQLYLYGIADQPDRVELAVTAADGKGGDFGRPEHEGVRIGRESIHHDVQAFPGAAASAVTGHKPIQCAVQGSI